MIIRWGQRPRVSYIDAIAGRHLIAPLVAVDIVVQKILSPMVASIAMNAKVKYNVDINDLNLTIPLATDDPAEQQKVLIENFILIQRAIKDLTP